MRRERRGRNVLWGRRRGCMRDYTKMRDMWGRCLVGGRWQWNTADVGKDEVGRIVYNVISGGRGHIILKTYLYTRHELEEALAVHRPAVLRTQGLEDGVAYQLREPARWTRRNGEFLRITTPIIYGPDARLQGGSWLRIFPLEAVRQSVTRMIESSDQSSPSAVGSDHDLADRRTGLWQTNGIEGCTGTFYFAEVFGDRVNATRTAEVTLPIFVG
jgi:hypothetical protein